MQLRVTPTALKNWFQYRCDRKFVYETMSRDLSAEIPIHEQSVPSHWGDEGTAYERRIVTELTRQLPGAVLLPGAVDDGTLTDAASRRFLQRGDPGYVFAHQLLLKSTASLRRRFRLPDTLEISSGKVDLVEVIAAGGNSRFRVIDIKASQVATLFHKVQVAFYALMLEATLAEHSIPGEIDAVGQIWHRTGHGGTTWVQESFDVRSYMRLVDDFFQQPATQFTHYAVAPGGIDETPFHIYFKCEQCKYLAHCRRTVADELSASSLDLSAIAGMSHQAKKSLFRLGIKSVGELIAKEGLLRGQDDWALRAHGVSLVRRAKALSEGKVTRFLGQYSLQMPPRVDRPIYIAADRDPVDGRLVALGCLCIGDEGREKYHVSVIRTHAEEAAALIKVLGVVLVALDDVDQWNQAHADDDPRHTHIFTYEPAEAADLRDAIGRHLDRPEMRKGLLDLIRIFPPEQVMPEPDYQGFHHLPASSLRNVMTDLYGLPVKVAHDLARVSQAVMKSGASLSATYQPEAEFARPFSSRLSIEVCRRAKDSALIPRIESDIQQRLAATHAIAQWVSGENGKCSPADEFLRLRKKPFRFRQQFNPLGAGDLDVLQAQSLLDSRSAMLQALVELARPAQQRRDRLNCYAELSLVDENSDPRGNTYLTFHVPESSRQAELSSTDFGLILSDDSPDLLLNPELWPALQATLLAPDGTFGLDKLKVKIWKGTLSSGQIPRLLKERRAGPWYLDRAFTDLNTAKAINFLTFLAQEA